MLLFQRPGALWAGSSGQGGAEGDAGLKRADFDAMTAAARIEYCDCRNTIDCEGSGTRSQRVGYQVGISGMKVMEAVGSDVGHGHRGEPAC